MWEDDPPLYLIIQASVICGSEKMILQDTNKI